MKIYTYSPRNGVFLGAAIAQKNPMRADEFLMPAWATDIAPPDAVVDMVAVYDAANQSWSLVADHRGETVFNTETGAAFVIDEPGDIPEGHTTDAPPSLDATWDGAAWQVPAATVDQLFAAAASRRYRAEIGGCLWNGWVQATDDRGQAKCMAELQAINEGLRLDGDGWKFAHGFEALTNAQMRDLVIAVRAHVSACYEAEGAIRIDIEAGNITALDDVENWPDWPGVAS
ncbi:DUF4376 domain-containing protein [Thalassospira marina]|uniref:DUF4376 domain-containing protein n=1 Tax=Thalassospira marina TaxID=2048283 RepID=A0A2N3KJN2_9PROT|nr:DUF4376 domain-containing protein [Thalassospira marina]PKR50754.1 hypothetical protein COO20_20160 [Thalassospira marina]